MIATLNEEIAVAFALPMLAVVAQTTLSVRSRLHTYAKARCVLSISSMIMAEEEPTDEEMRALRLRFPLAVILDAVIFISEHIYGNALNRLALIVEVCEVDYYLLGRIRRRQGRKKAFLLSKLSRLTHVTTIIERAEEHLEHKRQDVRFYATAALVAARPERAIKYVVRLDNTLSWYQVAILTQLMRSVGAPIAYTPMLASQNRNLQLIGIYLSEHFSIVDAEPYLQQLVESEDEEVSYLSLLSLCSIRGDISTTRVGVALARLSPSLRDDFLRHAVQACYSLRSCAHHLSCRECDIFSQRITSYKSQIRCN